MRSRRKVVVGALGAVVALVLAACGGGNVASSGGSGSGGGGGGAADANGVHNPSDQTGGTLRYANSGDWDSLDPADTYAGPWIGPHGEYPVLLGADGRPITGIRAYADDDAINGVGLLFDAPEADPARAQP